MYKYKEKRTNKLRFSKLNMEATKQNKCTS